MVSFNNNDNHSFELDVTSTPINKNNNGINESVFKLLGISENSTSTEIKKAYINALDKGLFKSVEEFNKVREEVDRLYRLRRESGLVEGRKTYDKTFESSNMPSDAFMNLTHNSNTHYEGKKFNENSSSIAGFMRSNDKDYFDRHSNNINKGIDPINLPKKEVIYNEPEIKKDRDVDLKRVNKEALKKKKLKLLVKVVIATGIIVGIGVGGAKLSNRVNYIDGLNDYYKTCDTEIEYVVSQDDSLKNLEQLMEIKNIDHVIKEQKDSIDYNEKLYDGDVITAKVPKNIADELIKIGKARLVQNVNENNIEVEIRGRIR